MRLSTTVACLILIQSCALGQEVDLQIEKRGLQAGQAFIAAKKDELSQRIRDRAAMKQNPQLTGDLTTSDHFLVSGGNNEKRQFVTSNKKTLQEALEKNKQQIEELRSAIESAPAWRIPEIVVYDLEIPCFGIITNSIEVLQITGDSKFLGKAAKATLLFEGFDTSKFADGESVGLSQVVKITTTETYTTVIGGSKTVYKVVPLNEQEKASLIESQTKKREPYKGETFRTWTDSTKKFSVDAWFVERDKAEIVLKKESGDVIRIPLSKLSIEDKKWIKDWEL